MRHCEHVKSNGHFCGSPALRGRNYCYFHLTHIGRQLRAEQHALRPGLEPFLELPLLEDAASIQLALMQVTNALLRGTLDPKRAGLVLYSLQTASINLRNMARDSKEDADAAICNDYDSFEQDYELDGTIDLRVSETADDDSPAAQARAVLSHVEAAGLTFPAAPIQPPEDAAYPEDEDTSVSPNPGALNPGFGYSSAEFADDEDDAPAGPEVSAPALSIPLLLTPQQYQQAKISTLGYELLHGIDVKHPNGRPLTLQRPAKSQKIFLNARKPPASAAPAENVTVAMRPESAS